MQVARYYEVTEVSARPYEGIIVGSEPKKKGRTSAGTAGIRLPSAAAAALQSHDMAWYTHVMLVWRWLLEVRIPTLSRSKLRRRGRL